MTIPRPGVLLLITIARLTCSGQMIAHEILPSSTQGTIQDVHGPHLVSAPATGGKAKLLLSFPGTGAPANAFHDFDSVASLLGYHTISLDYKNEVITTVCRPSLDENCFNSFRQEIAFGTPVSDSVMVDSTNSIYNRLIRLLQFLSAKYPGERWSQFLKGGKIAWNHISTVGHSQGAGHAAYLGKFFKLDRVIALSGPQDFLDRFDKPAPWIRSETKTPSLRFYSLLHRDDPFGFQKQLTCNIQLSGTSERDTVSAEPLVAVKGNIFVLHLPSQNAHGASMLSVHADVWRKLLQN